ncbi:MAG: hypothetical protein AB7N80_05645 [Bdellovibrionales bacterium]
MNFILRLVLIGATLWLTACASAPTSTTPGSISEEDYIKQIQSKTQNTSQYDGFYQTFQASATLLTTDMTMASLARRADMQRWDSSKLQKERDRSFQEMAADTKFIVRLFTPEHQYNDLHQPASTWKVYLEHEGKRYEGKAKKLTEKFMEVRHLYPYADRFSNFYEVTFKLPTTSAETSSVKFILTGPLGTAEFTYSAK